MNKTIKMIASIIVSIVIVVIIGSLLVKYYKFVWNDCRQVGHSYTYCILRLGK